MPLNTAPQIPTGPVHSFTALPYPLPQAMQEELHRLALAIRASSHSRDKLLAIGELDSFVEISRQMIGVEVTRSTYLIRGQHGCSA